LIERFNFYDVYGYFIPGALLIAVLWAPHALVQRAFPASEISAALAMIVAAYVVGHMLQIVAAKALPSSELFGGEYRAPSDLLLEETHPQKVEKQFRDKLAGAVRSAFGLDLNVPESRRDAFLLCRNRVIAAGTASYVEQFEGMYVMMRGISAASAIGFAYALGWLCSGSFATGAIRVALVLLFIASGVLWGFIDWKHRAWRLTFTVTLMATVACAGIVAATGAPDRSLPLFAVAALSLTFAILAHSSYRSFTWTWARTVYQLFYLWSQAPDDPKTK
jgi:hypothetical protein